MNTGRRGRLPASASARSEQPDALCHSLSTFGDQHLHHLRDPFRVHNPCCRAAAILAAQSHHDRSPGQVLPPPGKTGEIEPVVFLQVADGNGILLAACAPGEAEDHEVMAEQAVEWGAEERLEHRVQDPEHPCGKGPLRLVSRHLRWRLLPGHAFFGHCPPRSIYRPPFRLGSTPDQQRACFTS